MRTTLGILALLAAAGCVRTIDPAAHSGADAKYKGAHAVELDGNAGTTTGIVTYPGGDRVDWKKIELPADQHGALELELSWRAPRPGLDLAFEVYSEWGEKLGEVERRKWSSTRKSARRASGKKTTTIVAAKGTIYVSVFASNRGDAGRYKLSATFTPEQAAYDPKFDELLQERLANGLKIGDPPKLARVYAPCGDDYDKTNPDCVENPPVCDRAKKDKANPSCQHLCDENKLDPKNPDCKQFYTCTTATWVDPAVNPVCGAVAPPPPPAPAESVEARINNPEIKDGKLWITIAVGKDSPVEKGWTGSLVDGNGKRLAKGAFTIIKVQKGLAYAIVGMALDDVNRNLDVVIDPPALK